MGRVYNLRLYESEIDKIITHCEEMIETCSNESEIEFYTKLLNTLNDQCERN